MTDPDALVKELQEQVSRWVDLSERWAVHAARAIATLEQQAAEIARKDAALEAICNLCQGEIDARWMAGNYSMTETEAAHGSRLYPLLSLPRNIARQALKGQP